MEAAADLLVSEPQLSICEVAEAAGYENQSKFSAAFKSVFGVPLLPTAANHGELIGLKICLNGRRYYPFRSATINNIGGNMTLKIGRSSAACF